MKKVEISVFRFNELNDDARQKALDDTVTFLGTDDWYEFIYEDAETVGLKITSFELDRSRGAKGHLLISALDVAFRIKLEHGEETETYKTAMVYIADYDGLNEKFKEEFANEEFSNYDSELNERDEEFIESLLEDYAMILQKEADYLQSEACAIETIEANDYWFTEEGEIYNGEIEEPETQGGGEIEKSVSIIINYKGEATRQSAVILFVAAKLLEVHESLLNEEEYFINFGDTSILIQSKN